MDSESTVALAHLDTVLMIDPGFTPALEYYITILDDQSNNEEAIKYALRFKEYHPESITPYQLLVPFYQALGRYDEAITESRALLEIDPGNTRALVNLTRIYITIRDFENARLTAEKIKEYHEDDPYDMVSYYNLLYNLANWRGKFKSAAQNLHQSLKSAMITRDSSRIFLSYFDLAQFYYEMGNADSAIFYNEEAAPWAQSFQSLNYPLFLVQLDRSRGAEVKEKWDIAIENFKANVPNELWPLADAIADIFEAYFRADTAAIITGYEYILTMPFQENSGYMYELGRLLVKSGQYERAIDYLDRLVEGQLRSSGAILNLKARYYLGMAYEGLGNTDEAILNYEEILKFWGDPEIETKEIKDAKRRLGRLVG